MTALIEKYKETELTERKSLSNTYISAFYPHLFEKQGYPTHIQHEDEVWKYLDSMHDLRFESNLQLVGNDPEDTEFVKAVLAKYKESVAPHLYKVVYPRASFLRALHQAKILKFLAPETDSLRVAELGPGSGYLSLILALKKHKVLAIENTQGFYISQNILWSKFDLSVDDFVSQKQNPSANIRHCPWWEVTKLFQQPPAMDIFYCNHAITEMSATASTYYIHLAKKSLSNSNLGYFILDGIYDTYLSSTSEVIERMYKSGFVLVYKKKDLWVFQLRDKVNNKKYFQPRTQNRWTKLLWKLSDFTKSFRQQKRKSYLDHRYFVKEFCTPELQSLDRYITHTKTNEQIKDLYFEFTNTEAHDDALLSGVHH